MGSVSGGRSVLDLYPVLLSGSRKRVPISVHAHASPSSEIYRDGLAVEHFGLIVQKSRVLLNQIEG